MPRRHLRNAANRSLIPHPARLMGTIATLVIAFIGSAPVALAGARTPTPQHEA
jgi:hypothetical protein